MRFNGSNIGKIIDVSANGSLTRFTRNVASVTMDLNSVEEVDFNALGGTDVVNVNDLKGTDTRRVNVNLAGFDGTGGAVVVGGLAATVSITNSDGAGDVLTVNGQDGVDRITIDYTTLPPFAISLVTNAAQVVANP